MKHIVYIINVDWYFKLHWIDRALFAMSNGYKVSIITTITDPEIQSELELLGFDVIDLNLNRKSLNPFKEIKYIVALYKKLIKAKPDIIHTITIKPNIYMGLINKIVLKIPIVYSITGLGAIFSNSKFKYIKKIIVFLYKKISVDNSRFIFENNDDYDLFNKLNITNGNGVVIHGAGVDTCIYQSKRKPEINSVLFASRLLKDKGLDTLIKSVTLLRDKGIKCDLNVAGIIDEDVNNAIPLVEIKELNQKGIINWLGNCVDMVDVINKNAIVCLPTRYGEGVPRILIEAASCERPIITTNVSGCREIVIDKKNGYLIDIDDSEALAYHLEYLFNNENVMLSMGKNGRDRVLSIYNKDIVLNKTFSIYLLVSNTHI
ncbi:glycosyltransferase family 4 protein [Photobacterium leiognathi]|uniref:glycosyltransferase family 4 protein n=1 Tax=Photobacterium leiognathi TaxID=553611 RepID=UPI002980E290|nr:glycosyltransferase family 4 protein [Photobacterium leiognathi]